MPVRSLNSSIMKWPNRTQVHSTILQWIEQFAEADSKLAAAGYFGSYARDEAGVGSDLDVIMIVTENSLPFERRYNLWDFSSVPVPVEAQVYTVEEWKRLPLRQPRYYETLVRETCWLYGKALR